MIRRIGLVTVGVLLAGAAGICAQNANDGLVLPPPVHNRAHAAAGTRVKPAANAPLFVTCDMSCTWSLDGEAQGKILAGASTRIRISTGQHFVEATAVDGAEHQQRDVTAVADQQVVVHFELQPLRDARLRQEQVQREAQQREQQRRQEEQQQAQRRREEAEKEVQRQEVQRAQEYSDRFEGWLKQRRDELSPNITTLRIKNRCSKAAIRFVVRFKVPDNSGHWATSGWWTVEPGKDVTPIFATQNRYVYVYAESSDKKLTWDGSDKTDSAKVTVVSNNFVQQDGDALQGVNQRTVSMFQLDTGTSWGEFSDSLTCDN